MSTSNKPDKKPNQPTIEVELTTPRMQVEEAKKILESVWKDGY